MERVRRKWTLDEERFIIENKGKDVKWMAEKLDRTRISVKSKIDRMKKEDSRDYKYIPKLVNDIEFYKNWSYIRGYYMMGDTGLPRGSKDE